MSKLVVSILGNRNSGKSTTWNTLFGNTVKTGKKLRRLYFNDSEYVEVFLISGSPEERGKDVEKLLTRKQARIILCSVQYKESVKNTFNYFINDNFSLYTQWLNPGYDDNSEKYFDNLGLTNWLLSNESVVALRSGKDEPSKRVNEIKDHIYGWAKSRNLILLTNNDNS